MISLGPDECLHLARLEVMYEHLRSQSDEACGVSSNLTALFADWVGALVAQLHEEGNWLR